MKKINQILFGVIALTVLLSGCDSLLDVDSERIMLAENHQIDSPNDSIYSMVGIFTQLQKLADRYVLFGELRADLMEITENANPTLQEIYKQDISEDNPYNVIEDYYSVINHCNYLIYNIDTTIVTDGEKSLLKEYAAAKTFRAWTYMQLALNYGAAKYYTEPLLTVQDAEQDFPEYSLQELLPVLIQDLEPVKYVKNPGAISLGADLTSYSSFIPARLLLGDLYLWNGQYENAAREYYALMDDNTNRYLLFQSYSSTWEVDNGVFVNRLIQDQDYLNIFDLAVYEQLSLIAGSTELGEEDELFNMTVRDYELAPSQLAIDNWDAQTYYESKSATNPGDLRGLLGSYLSPGSYFGLNFQISGNVILKYELLNSNAEVSKAVLLYRVATLYLHYAEAVNRAGKPNLAFAVLKNGLNSDAMALDTIVPPREKYTSSGAFIDYVNFEKAAFDNNIGIHSRGCGNIDLAVDYVIPQLNSLEDSILYVEDKIIEELALETAFEGNRFQDLMRVAFRRGDASYLADKVAEKYSDKSSMKALLMDENNWYIKP